MEELFSKWRAGQYCWFIAWDPDTQRDVEVRGRIIDADDIKGRPGVQNLLIARDGLTYNRWSNEIYRSKEDIYR